MEIMLTRLSFYEKICKKEKHFKKRVKRFLLLLGIILIGLMPQNSFAQSEKITIKKEAMVSLTEVFDLIKEQTNYTFIHKSNLFDGIPPVQIKKGVITVKQLLEESLAGTNFTYKLSKGNSIIIKIRQPVPDIPLIKVEGRVTDKDNNPLPGATVLIKGRFKGTTTDAKGNYAIKVPEGSVLVFSFIGYQTQEITVSVEDTEINVVMEQKAAELGEVSVISTGYQKIKPEQSTGSVATMRVKEYNSRINTTDFLTGLENRIPGLLINNDVEFEGNSLFQIRGISTINGNKDPLIVIDGYPTELSLDMINPNEIESVTVLKDAAAATIYGARSSNGVIVIERKKAKAGKSVVNFRATASFTPKENYDRYRWDKDASSTSIDYEKTYNQNISPILWSFYFNRLGRGGRFINSPPYIILLKEAAGVITPTEAEQQLAALSSYNNANDYKRLFLRTAVTQTYNLDISGGNEKVLYYLTANYNDHNASEIKNDNSSFKLSGRLMAKFSDRFSLELTTDIQQTKKTSVPIPDINGIYSYERFEDEEGNPLPIVNGSRINPNYNDVVMSLGLLDNLYYPLQEINEVSTKTNDLNNRITANFRYNIGNGFNLNFGGVYETSRTDTKHLATENSSEVRQYMNLYAESDGAGGFIFNIPQGGFLKQTNANKESYTLRAQLNYDKQINENHSLNLILGGEIRDVLGKLNSSAYFGYNDQTLLHQAVDYTILNRTYSILASNFANNPVLLYDFLFNQRYTDNRYVSLYSNVVYAYKGKYSFTGSIRIDQSNLFGTNRKYRYKPLWSVGAAWNIHKENFMQDMDWVKSLKFRVAYGFNGNVAKNALPQVIAQAGLSNFYLGSPMLSLMSFGNSGLRWEQTQNFNIGLDYTIFKNISGSIDYYLKKSTDILANNQIDASKGGAYAVINQASIRNSGLEVSLHADWITRKDFNWNSGLVFSHNRSKVLEVYNEAANLESSNTGFAFILSAGSNANYMEGYAVGTLFDHRYAGLDSSGKILVYNKDGEIIPFSQATLGDVDYAGTSIPSFSLGVSNRVDIGNFYAYCMINFYGGFKVRVPVPDPSTKRPLEGAGNFWKEAGDEADPDVLPSLFDGYASELAYTDKYTVNGAYLTLSDLTVSYSFRDSQLVKKTGITNLEVRLQASNLYTVGLNKYNYSKATGSYAKSYLTPTYTIGLYVNF